MKLEVGSYVEDVYLPEFHDGHKVWRKKFAVQCFIMISRNNETTERYI